MSIVLLTLPGGPKVSEDAIKQEKELEDLIEKKVSGRLLFIGKELNP